MAFKSEWKASYLIKEVKHDKYKFHRLPCGKNLTCHHRGLKDVKGHCNKHSHRRKLMMHGRSEPSTYGSDTENVFKNTVLNAEVMVTNFIIQHNLSNATADHLAQLFKNIFPDRKLLHHMQVPKQKLLQYLIRLLCHTVTATWLTTAKTIHSVLAMIDQMIPVYKK